MFYFDAASQINLLINLCFPFCILLFSLWFKNAEPFPRLIGFAFWAPLFLNCASFLASRNAAAQSLAAVSSLVLLAEISAVLIIRPGKKRVGPFQTGLLLFPILVFLVISGSPSIQNFLTDKPKTILILIVLVLVNLYFLKKEKGPNSILFWNMLSISAGTLSGLLPAENALRYLVPAFALVSYVLFLLYFHQVFLKDMLKIMGEAERKLFETSRSIDYEVKKRVMEIEKVNENLVNISKTDSLTKALNKTAILDFIEKLILTKAKSEFSILMFDIDNFKTINDTLGHVTGDKCIKNLALLVRGNLREFDVVGRYGGDEFIIVLPGAGIGQAMMIAERFRKKIESTESPHFTISTGIATYPQDGVSVKQLIQVADDGLYISKAKGKNTISHKG